ncbi:Protein lin-28 B [Turdus rufiventris]|nr:Protein lin-28 B [Turdus rufiventris]
MSGDLLPSRGAAAILASPLPCPSTSISLSLLGFRCYNCGGLDHHAKECSLPPQPKKCHYCQSIMHMVANCPHKTVSQQQQPSSSQGRHEAEPQPSTSALPREGGGTHGFSSPSHPQEGRPEISERSGRSPQEASSRQFHDSRRLSLPPPIVGEECKAPEKTMNV